MRERERAFGLFGNRWCIGFFSFIFFNVLGPVSMPIWATIFTFWIHLHIFFTMHISKNYKNLILNYSTKHPLKYFFFFSFFFRNKQTTIPLETHENIYFLGLTFWTNFQFFFFLPILIPKFLRPLSMLYYFHLTKSLFWYRLLLKLKIL